MLFVVGAPYGLALTLTVGHVSGRAAPTNYIASRSASAWEFFQTDAAINGGNSGSPMFNWKGEVIGIVSNILSRSGGFEGIGFAATSKMARLLLEQEPFWSATFAALGRADFGRAWFLAQQLVARDISALAQLGCLSWWAGQTVVVERAAGERRWNPSWRLYVHRMPKCLTCHWWSRNSAARLPDGSGGQRVKRALAP